MNKQELKAKITELESKLEPVHNGMKELRKTFNYEDFIITHSGTLILLLNEESKKHVVRMLRSMTDYFSGKWGCGSFVANVCQRDFYNAMQSADNTNLYMMPIYGKFLYNHCPSNSYEKSKLEVQRLRRELYELEQKEER